MLGKEVARAAAGHELVALTRTQLDVTDPDAVLATVEERRPDVVLNCAAWTDVDGAEDAYENALAVNGNGAGYVALAAARSGAWIVHMSSDYVFDGERREPYVESDLTEPLSAYGHSKLAGELAVAEAAPGRHTIVRTSWLFGAGGRCFPATILRQAAERDAITVADDQIACPTFAGDLAGALVRLCAQPVTGIIHMAGDGACSRFEFASAIVDRAGLPCRVLPGQAQDPVRTAARPAYSVLGSKRLAKRLPHWQDGLWQYMAERTGTVGAL